jgi:hypothetical protein
MFRSQSADGTESRTHFRVADVGFRPEAERFEPGFLRKPFRYGYTAAFFSSELAGLAKNRDFQFLASVGFVALP